MYSEILLPKEKKKKTRELIAKQLISNNRIFSRVEIFEIFIRPTIGRTLSDPYLYLSKYKARLSWQDRI